VTLRGCSKLRARKLPPGHLAKVHEKGNPLSLLLRFFLKVI